jgi:hypothetical protein
MAGHPEIASHTNRSEDLQGARWTAELEGARGAGEFLKKFSQPQEEHQLAPCSQRIVPIGILDVFLKNLEMDAGPKPREPTMGATSDAKGCADSGWRSWDVF